MATQGPNIAGTGADAGFGGGSATWASPGNITADDGSIATASLTSGAGSASTYLVASNFGFSIPAGATIDGVFCEAEVRARNAADDAYFSTQLLCGSGTGGSSNGTMASDLIAATYTVYTNGSSTDKWLIASELTPTNINDSAFAFRFYVAMQAIEQDIQVDFVRITVYYTEASGGGNFFALLRKLWNWWKGPKCQVSTWRPATV